MFSRFRGSKKCINREAIEVCANKICSLFYSEYTRSLPRNLKKFDNLKTSRENRCLSTLNLKVAPQTECMLSEEDINQFTSSFSHIVSDLTKTSHNQEIDGFTQHYERILKYNVPNGKHQIGHSVVASYKTLESAQNLTPKSIHLANILGWCSEMLASSFYINDDVVDASEVRNGMPCWYKHKEVGIQAINDALLLENGLYTILKKYFSGQPCYIPILNLFHDVTNNAAIGQTLDTMTMKNGKPALELFTMSRYNAIIKYKAGYIMFKLPIGLAMYFANMFDKQVHKQANGILFKIGQFYQVHNDILNCFGDPSVAAKDGSDIREGKCTWLIVEALHRATPIQRELLQENYGQSDPQCEKAVKNLYQELGLLDAYSICNKLVFDIIQRDISQLSNEKLRKLFSQFMKQRADGNEFR